MSGINPGDLESLGSIERLAAAGEWTVLAAIASITDRSDAVAALAAAADKEAAFRWMWAVTDPSGQLRHWQQVNDNLANNLRVPENLRLAVRQFVLTPIPQQETAHHSYQLSFEAQRTLLRKQAQARFLAKLNPRTDFARDLARAVIQADEERYWPELCHAAFDILGVQRQKDDRKFVLKRAEDMPPRKRLRSLLSLSAPYSKSEQVAFLAALKTELPFGSHYAPGYSQRPDVAVEVHTPHQPPRIYLFDPKYKLEGEFLEAEGGDGKPKKIDIDKMHAYRDAIRDEEGRRAVRYAAVLYPGTEDVRYATGLEALRAYPDTEQRLERRIGDVLREALTDEQ